MTDWLIALGTIASLILLWQQNRILTRQGPPAVSADRTKMRRYWPLWLMVVLVALNAGFSGYVIHERGMGRPASGIPTELRLQFYSGTEHPRAFEKRNISHWDAIDMGMEAECRNPTGRLVATQAKQTWILVLIFSRRITIGEVRVDSDVPLPRYEVKDRTERSAIIYFEGDLIDRTLTVKVLS